MNPTCKSIIGTLDRDKNVLDLLHVREVLFRPLGSHVRGNSLHNINTYRMMYMEMVERGTFAPRVQLNIPQHTILPINNILACEDNIYQEPVGFSSRNEPSTSSHNPCEKSVRVRDCGSYKLFGKNFLYCT